MVLQVWVFDGVRGFSMLVFEVSGLRFEFRGFKAQCWGFWFAGFRVGSGGVYSAK